MRVLPIVIILLCWFGPAWCVDGFVENRGQWDGDFRYKAEISAGKIYLERGSILFHLMDVSEIHYHHIGKGGHLHIPTIRHHAFRLKVIGANQDAEITEHFPFDPSINYFLGSDPKRWKSDLKGYRQITYHDIYKGVDMHVYVNGTGVKYEFELEAEVDPSIIRLELEGSDGQRMDKDGNLLIFTQLEDVKESKPVASQKRGKKDYDIACEFQLEGNTIRYAFPEGYDRSIPLLIDPELIFSTFSGSASDNFGYTATFDDDGHLYGGSTAFGDQYPTTTGAWDETFNNGQTDLAITKFNLNGTGVIYSTYIGGAAAEMPHSMITDDDGRLYILGTTGSDNFPVTSGVVDNSFNGGPSITLTSLGLSYEDGADMFVTALTPNGNALAASTFLGGSNTDGLNTAEPLRYNYADEARGEINIGKEGDIYIASCSRSNDFPVVNAPVSTGSNGTQNGIISRMNPSLTNLIWSARWGGESADAIFSIDFAEDSTLYVAGGTVSNNFPTTTGAFDEGFNSGRSDAFLSHLNENGTAVISSTYYGTSAYDQAYFVRIDREGRPSIFGQTEHAGAQLIFNVSYFDNGGGQFIARFDEDLSSLDWSTQFGSTPGQPNISPTAFLVDVCNSVYLSGWGGFVNSVGTTNNASNVSGLDVTFDAFQSTTDFNGSDFYLMVLSSDGNSLLYGSFYGGSFSSEHVDGGTSRFDRSGKIYQAVCAGCGGASDFPIKPDPGAHAVNNPSPNCNLGVFKMDFELPLIIADFNMPGFGCAPLTINPNNQSISQDNTSYSWFVEGAFVSAAQNPSFTFQNSGTFEVTLVLNDPLSCNFTDTITRQIEIQKDTSYTLPPVPACIDQVVTLGPDPDDYDDDLDIRWSPSGPLNASDILNPRVALRNSATFTMIIDYGGCQETVTQEVQVDNFPVDVTEDTIVCSTSEALQLVGTSFGEAIGYEWSSDSLFEDILSTDSAFLIGNWPDGLNFYYFRATKPNGCQNLDTALITVSDYDLELSPDSFICFRDTLRIQALSRNPQNTFTYLWTDNAIVSDTFNQNLIGDTNLNFLDVSPEQDNTYHLLALSKAVDNCLVQDSTRVNVSQLDPETVTADAEKHSAYFFERVQLTGTPELEGTFTGFWTPARLLNDSLINDPVATMALTTTFNWTVTDEAYPTCKYGDTTIVEVFEIVCEEPNIFIPDAFTPNGDGSNDELFVRGQYLESIDFSVYNRWGEQVFATQTLNEGWDGTFNGSNVEPAVYVYQLTAFCLDGARYYTKGNVTVIR